MELLGVALKQLSIYKKDIALVLVALTLAKLSAFGVPLVLKNLVDNMTGEISKEDLYLTTPIFLVFAYGFFMLSALIFDELKEYFSAKISHKIIAHLGVEIFQKIHSLPFQFHLKKQSGVLTREIDRGIRALQLLISIAIHSIIPSVIELFIVLIYFLIHYNWLFSAILVATLITYLIFTGLVTNLLTNKKMVLNEADSNLNQKLVDTLLNIENVKLFGNESFEAGEFKELTSKHLISINSIYKTYSLLSIGQQFIVCIGICSILWMSILGIETQTMAVGDLVLVSTLVMQIFLPISALGVLYKEAKQSVIDIQNLNHIVAQNESIEHFDLPTIKLKNPKYGPKIRIENLSFRFSPDREILKNISFEIQSGESIAIVGASGSGKSTITKLLFRFYEPIEGSIFFDEQNISDFQIDSVRNLIGVVPQEISLFNGTILYNLGYGRVNSSIAKIIEVSKAAQLHEFIMSLPEKYETLVGERGLMLSGGERQRIGIARALLKNPSVLIFDEATSSLDSNTESAVHEQLLKSITNKTTIIIAHRLSTIVDVDKIIVMHDGRVLEIGSHCDLLLKNGAYASLWNTQIKSPIY